MCNFFGLLNTLGKPIFIKYVKKEFAISLNLFFDFCQKAYKPFAFQVYYIFKQRKWCYRTAAAASVIPSDFILLEKLVQ